MEKSKSGSVIVSWSFAGNESDTSVLLVGKKAPGKDVEIINAFQGEEALKIFEMLTKKKEESSNVSGN